MFFYCSPPGFELYFIPLYLSGLQNGFFASPSCFVLFIFVFVQKLCFPFDTLRNACFLIVCAELQEEKRKLASCHFFAGGGKQEGCLHSFLYYLYLFVSLLFTSIIFFKIICSSFLREEVSRRVAFITFFLYYLY